MIQIAGTVDSEGHSIVGEGYTSQCEQEQGLNMYRINFSQGLFTKTPTIIVTPDVTGIGFGYTIAASVFEPDKDTFQVHFQDLNCKRMDCAFHFIAMGE